MAQQYLKLQNSIMKDDEENRFLRGNQEEMQIEQDSKNLSEIYKVQLSQKQLSFLMKFFPSGYSLQFESKIQKKVPGGALNKPIRNPVTKKKSADSKLFNENQQVDLELNRAPSIRSKKSINGRYADDMNEVVYNKYTPMYQTPEINRRNTYDNLDESLKPCVKILNLLKNSKTSWPFRQPVDPEAMGIPQYNQIIKQPMDLSKIQQNLRTGQYATPTQFHADLGKIIRNSYTFNKGNMDFTRVTEQFQQYYFKVIADPNQQQKSATFSESIKISKPPIQSSMSSQIKKKKPQKPFFQSSISLAQKKQLSINIRKLSRQHMKGIVDIVREQNDSKIKDEFDLQDLKPQTIRKLQNYVREKLMATQRAGDTKINEHQNGNQQSEFEIQSEEDS